MDLLESVMELLNNTSSPSISSSSNINSTTHGDSIYQIPTMESNNLVQETISAAAAGGGGVGQDVSTVAGGDGVTVESQQSLEDTFSPLLPRLELKLPRSSSSSESESEEAANPTAGTSTEGNGDRVASPPPNCAICLGRCKNKCFTDSCMHQFCFKCLCEWSKVKPECPLCKQTFKSIIHNVKSEDQFEEYHVQPPTVQIAHPQFEMDLTQMRIFGVVSQNIGRNETWNDRVHRPLFFYPGSNGSATVSASGSVTGAGGSSNRSTPIGSLRSQYVYRDELLDLYRQEYPDSTLSQLWRRYVYDRKLYALPVCDITGRFRDSSSQYYRDNPAQIHRLVPWINRDLQCLLRQSQHDVNSVLESINTALSLMNIISPAFRRRLQSFLGNKTAHFIHELNNFARSPYDMFGYDRVVEYSPQSSEGVIIEFTSSDDSTDNDDIDVADDSAVDMPNAASINGGTIEYDDDYVPSYHRVLNAHLNSFTAINLTIHNRLTTNAGRGGDAAAGPSGTMRSSIQDGVSLVIDLRGETEEPSASDDVARVDDADDSSPAQQTATVPENIELTSGSSDECEFVLERKAPHLRTPEMVSLDSASDSDVVFVEESKPLSKATFSTSEGEPDDEEATVEKPKRSTNRSKITALVESKKRNQQTANIVKNETQRPATEVYNVGASTSAALRLSIQQRSDRSRVRRTKYSLRNTRAETDQQQPKRRGKRLPSESSHSSSSAASTSSSIASNSATGSSSDEEYVVSAPQRRNTNQRKRRRTKKAKSNTSSKSDSRKRKKLNNNNDPSFDEDDDNEDEEEENGHLGKNFALVMAIGERLKREKEKLKRSRAANDFNEEEDDDDEHEKEAHSEGENSWRLKAVNEPLRKQQEQQVKAALLTSNERKRKIRKSSQKTNENAKQSKIDHCGRTEVKTPNDAEDATTYKNCDSSSDESESDNLKLIELKSKLIRKCSNTSLEETNSQNRLQANEEYSTEEVNATTNSQSQNGNGTVADSSASTTTACMEEMRQTEETHTTPTDKSRNMPPNTHVDDDDSTRHSSTDDDNGDGDGDVAVTCHEADLKAEDIVLKQDHSPRHRDEHHESGDQVDHDYKYEDKMEEGDIEDHNDNEYSNETTNLSSPMQPDGEDEEEGDEYHEEDDEEEGSEATLNIPTSMNLSHETNVFDGASMSTTTTDTILNDAAEQISSAAVSFYNPQLQSFNTADFDDNTSSNSSSSESSVSSTTTTSSSNSSSSNTNGFMNLS